MNWNDIAKLTKEKPLLQEQLFTRGFLMTNEKQDELAYPFFGKWNHYIFENYNFYIHPKQVAFITKSEKD